MSQEETFKSAIWNEKSSENPYYAQSCFCYGYDVYDDIIPNASYSDYLYLLLTGNQIPAYLTSLFEKVLMVLAHPGLRDPSVRAAMNAGVGGSRAAAALMAALAVGAGQAGGAHEAKLCLELCHQGQNNLVNWYSAFAQIMEDKECDVWLPLEHVPGFDPHQSKIALPTLSTLQLFASLAGPTSQCQWLLQHYIDLEKNVGYGLNIIAVVAAAIYDLKIPIEIAEYFFMMFRLPGAAIHAVETRALGFKHFPFFAQSVKLTNDPGPYNTTKES